jgi:hypothetical protein
MGLERRCNRINLQRREATGLSRPLLDNTSKMPLQGIQTLTHHQENASITRRFCRLSLSFTP